MNRHRWRQWLLGAAFFGTVLPVVAATNDQLPGNLSELATGAELRGDHETYRLLPGATIGTSPDGESWHGRFGRFHYRIDPASPRVSRSKASDSVSPAMALNPRTGKLALVTGRVVVWLIKPETAENIARQLGMTIADNFPGLGLAYLHPGPGASLTEAVASLSAASGVKRAYPEIIENIKTPR